MPTYVRRALYIVLGLLAFVLLLVIVAVVALQFPATQDFAARQAQNYLRKKLGTEVRIGKFRTDFKHAISLDDVYIPDQQRDTLLSVGHLGVNIDLWALTKSQINVKSLELDNGTLKIKRSEPDSVYNFDYITKAFSSGPATPKAPADTTGGFKYDIGDLRLIHIRLRYQDQIDGNDIRTQVGALAVTMDAVDVTHSIYKIDRAALKNTSIAIVQSKVPPADTAATKPLTLQFGLNRANLDNVSLTYRNQVAAQFISTHVGTAEITAKNIDLRNERIDLNKLTLKNTSFAYAQNQNVPVAQRAINPVKTVQKLDSAAEKAAAKPLKWRLTLGQSDISGVDVAFDNFNQPRQRTRLAAMDYNHLKFNDLTLNTENFFFSENRTTARINQLAGREQSGFRVESAKADVVYDSVQTRLDNLDLITPHTRIRRKIAIGYQSFAALSDLKQLPNLKIEGDLRDVRLGFRDILYLTPSLASTPPFTTGPNQSVLLSGRINGRVGDFRVQNLDFVGFRNTTLRASGRIQGLPNVDRRLYADLNIARFTTTEADIRGLVPKGTIPAAYQLPPRMALAGTFRGRPTAMVFDTNLRLNTSFGNATAFVNMQPGPKGREPITARFNVQGFDVGKVLRDPTIGRVTANGTLNARGLTPATMQGRLVATVQNARYQGYTYHGVDATVDIDRNRYVIAAASRQDPNLNLDLKAVVDLRDARNPTYAVSSLNLRGVNLTKLGFYTGGDLRVQGDLTANLSGSSANTINGTFSGRNVVIVRDNQPFAIDSLRGRVVQRPGHTELAVTSNILRVNLNGNTGLGDLATVLEEHIDRYFDLPGVRYRPGGPEHNFTFDAQVLDPRAITKLVPGLTKISPFSLTGSFDSRAADLTVKSRIPLIIYTGYRLDSLRLNVASDPQKLDYSLRLRQAGKDTTLRLPNPSLTGSIQHNRVGTHLRIAESDSATKLDLAGLLQVVNQGDAYAFSFDPKLVLNNSAWTVAPGNEVRYTTATGAIRANNVRLSQGQQFIELQTLPGAEYPLQARLGSLDLNLLARAGGLADSLVGGTLNGQAVVRSIGQPRMAFTSDLTLSKFAYNKSLIGDIALQATNPAPDRYLVDARLTGGPNNNDVRAAGTYLANGSLNMAVNLTRFNLNTIEPFAAKQLRNMIGYLSGQLAVTGTTAAPQVRGAVNTNGAGFTVSQLGAPYRLPDESLSFDAQGIRFQDFTVLDSVSNKAVMNGYIYTKNYVDDYRFDLTATTKNFMAVQSTQRDNPLYYGKLVVDSDTKITGNLNLPVIRTNATVVDGSALTVVVPNDDPVKVERDGIVEFVDLSAPLDTMLARKVRVDSAKVASGYDIAAVVTVTNRTPFTIIVDQASGDNLKVRANGTLNTAIDPSGTITLSGRLDVDKGQYHMSLYNLTTRDFDIARGSSITWTGDPYNAQVAVTAVYNVKAPPAELLSAQGLTNDNLQTIGRNQLPFRVDLKVNGDLLKPAISFDIRLPEDTRTELRGQIENRLTQLRQPSQTDELNKQVFSLLVLNRFLADDPFQSSSGSFVSEQLRGSASQVLTSQLNKLTGSYLSNLGVDLGINSTADFSSGSEKTRTDLNVAVRRQLLNNRLTVRLGTDVPLAGAGGGGSNQVSQGQGGVSQFAGDVSVEYNVLANGRLRLRAFRNNAYGDIDGQFVRTGASLIFQRDYRNLADLFRGIDKDVKQERKENRKQEKEEKKTAQDSVQTVMDAPRHDTTRVAAHPTTGGR